MPANPEPPDELMRLFDEHDNEVEPRTRQWIWDNKPGLFHAVGTVWIMNTKGELLCSRRSEKMKGNPGKWQTYFGGKVPVGSTPRETAIRELAEEADIIVDPVQLFPIEEGKRISRFLYLQDLDAQKFHSPDGEVTDVRWMTLEEFRLNEKEQPESWCNGVNPHQEAAIRAWMESHLRHDYDRFYSQTAEFAFNKGKPLKTVEKVPELLSSGEVLDLGSGEGRHSLFLAEKGFAVTAVDTSQVGLEKLRRFAGEKGLEIKTVAEDLVQWKFEQDYDVIVATVVFQHVATEDALRILGDMKAHTQPNGINIVSLFTKTGDRYENEKDRALFYPDDGWLKDFYRDWEILEIESESKPLIQKFRPDGSPATNVVEKILARKPSL